MICEKCNATGYVRADHQSFPDAAPLMFPCPECNGWGEVHCCDGLCAQPEDDE